MADTYDFHDALMRRMQLISAQGADATSWQRLQAQKRASDSLAMQDALFRGQPGVGVPNAPMAPAQQGSAGFESFKNAIAGKESGGNYNARNKSSGALGKYQVMPANVASWSREALGYSVTPAQFLASPQIQEAVAGYKLKTYYDKWGPAGAAVAWYAGPGAVGKSSNKAQGAYPSINSYSNSIVRAMGR